MENMKELATKLLNKTDAAGNNEVAEAFEAVNDLLREAEVANADEALALYAEIIAAAPSYDEIEKLIWWISKKDAEELYNYMFGHALRSAASVLDDHIMFFESAAYEIIEKMTAHKEYYCEEPPILAEKVINARAASKGSYPLGMLLYCVGCDCLGGDADFDAAIKVETELEKSDYGYASKLMKHILELGVHHNPKRFKDHGEWLLHCGRHFADHGDWAKSIWAYKLIVDKGILGNAVMKAAAANKLSLLLQDAADEYSELAKNLALAL